MSVTSAVTKYGAGQTVIVQGLIAKAYKAGMDEGSQLARKAAFREGMLQAANLKIKEADQYKVGFDEGVESAKAWSLVSILGALSSVLHKRYRFTPKKLDEIMGDVTDKMQSALHPSELIKECREFGLNLDQFNQFEDVFDTDL